MRRVLEGKKSLREDHVLRISCVCVYNTWPRINWRFLPAKKADATEDNNYSGGNVENEDSVEDGLDKLVLCCYENVRAFSFALLSLLQQLSL